MTRNLLRWTALAGLAALIAFALPAAAESYEGKPECPPDMMCTMSEPAEDGAADRNEPQALGPEDCIECSKPPESRGPADCEYCRGDEGNVSDGPSAPQDCGGEVCAYDRPDAPVDDGTCMDGADPHEICDRDVQYLGGNGGAGGGPEPTVESSGSGAKAVPALGLVGVALSLGLVAVLVGLVRRSR